MFIKIGKVNYFIPNESKAKTPSEIYSEIFTRMNVKYIRYETKRQILSEISQQLHLNSKTLDKI